MLFHLCLFINPVFQNYSASYSCSKTIRHECTVLVCLMDLGYLTNICQSVICDMSVCRMSYVSTSVSKASGLLPSTRTQAHIKAQFWHLSCTHSTLLTTKVLTMSIHWSNMQATVSLLAWLTMMMILANVDKSMNLLSGVMTVFLQLNVTKTK